MKTKQIVVGIDEVGRGPWAGPLVACAVALEENCIIDGVRDSKQLTSKLRQQAADVIRQRALAIGIGWVEPTDIDKLGLTRATTQAMKQALSELKVEYADVIIDGSYNYLADIEPMAHAMIKADSSQPCVAAASIVAKVARDTYMAAMATVYPQHDFGRHVGYGTAGHRQSLKEHGPTSIHRLSFAPLKDYVY